MSPTRTAGHRRLPVAGVVAILASVLLAACKPGFNAPTTAEMAARLEAPYDYYINGMRSWRFTAEGKTSFQLTASRVTHFPFDDHTDLERPILHWQQEHAAPWTIVADTSSVQHLNQADTITLTGNVRGNTSLPAGPLLVETSTLTVQTGNRTASTTADAELTMPASRLRGTGMQMDLSNNTISLLKDVRGTHAP